MARTKGSTNKPKQQLQESENNETKKRRGRQPGQVIEREPSIIVQLNDKFRVKIDKYNKTLQEKSEKKIVEVEDTDNEDAGWNNLGYFNSWECIFKTLVNELTRKKLLKVQKEHVIYFEKYLEVFEKATKEAKKMFANIDEVKMK